MTRNRPRWFRATLVASPTQIAVALNLLIALLVTGAVAFYLRNQYEQALHNVHGRMGNVAHAQALLINDDIQFYEGLLGQLETRLHVARQLLMPTAALAGNDRNLPMREQDLLRQFLDLAPYGIDLLLTDKKGSVMVATELLDGRDPLATYCKSLPTLAFPAGASALQVFDADAQGHCPQRGSLIYRKLLKSGADNPESLWLIVNPDHFEATLQQELAGQAGRPRYRIQMGASTTLISSALPADRAALWRFPADLTPVLQAPGVLGATWDDPVSGHRMGGVSAPVKGAGLSVQIVYNLQDAINPVWMPYARLWSSVALGFLLIWWLVSYLVVKLIRNHHADILSREQRFDRSLDFAEIGVWDWNVKSGNIYWSRRVAPMFGYPAVNTETSYQKFIAAVHPDDRRRVEQAIAQSLSVDEPYSLIHRVLWQDGTVRWVHEAGNALRDADGSATRMLGVVHDITEQRALQSNQRLLEAVVFQLNDIVFITEPEPLGDADRRIVFVNQAFVQHTGFSRDEMLGQSMACLYGPQTDQEEVARIQAFMRNRLPLRTELQAYTRSSARIWVDLNIQPLLEPDGTLYNWVIVARDITQRKAAETALRESQSRLSGVIESAMDAIISIDDAHAIILFNAGAEKMFGYRSQDMLGQTLDALLPQGLRALHAQHLDDYRHHSQEEHSANRTMGSKGRLRAVRASGQEFPIEASISKVVVDGHMILTVIVRDITDRLEGERQLRELNEHLEMRVEERTQALQVALSSAEQAKRSRGDFLAKMSHEIRTPMNAILGLTYLALHNPPGSRDEQHLQKIQQSGEHLLHMINDILDFSKIDAGKLEVDVGHFDLKRSIDHVMQLCEIKAREKQLTLQLQMDDDVPQHVSGDSLRLQQILINYINNAIKFTGQGQIAVRVKKALSLPATPPEPGFLLRVEVEDSGIGISEAHRSRLFESFEQADNSTTRQFGGTGLGLAICKQLAGLMGGEVGLSSQLGAGSVFWFTVRLQQEEAQAPRRTEGLGHEAAMQLLRGKRILVVDDNDLNLDVALGILGQWGVYTAKAANGVQAMAVLYDQPVDLVLMDMHMPVMDGLEACRRIRADAALAAIPVIAMTANARSEDHDKCFESGMNQVVTKPFVPDQLMQVVCRWLGSAEAQTPKEPASAPSVVAMPLEGHAASTLPVWDDTQLALYVGDDPVQQRRFVAKFQKAALDFMAKVAARTSDSWPAIADQAHKIKSSARTVGAMQMAAVCEQLEWAGNAEEAAQCETLVAALQQSYAETCHKMEERLAAYDGAIGA